MSVKTLSWFQENFSRKAFVQGLAAVGVIYVLLFAFVWLQKDKTVDGLRARMPTQTVLIEGTGGGIASLKGLPSQSSRSAVKGSPLASGVSGLYDSGLPVIRRRDGMTVFKAYRRPFDLNATKKPVISLAIADMGLSQVATESAIRTMPSDVSLIVSPYAKELPFWVKQAREKGHEVWMSLPVEANDYPQQDTGPSTSLIGVDERENLKKLTWLMGREEGVIGFVTGDSPAFLDMPTDLRPLLSEIYGRGMAFADTGSNHSSTAQAMAHGMRAPYAAVDLWIDSEPTPEAIQAALKQLEDIARTDGRASGIFHALPLSYQEVLNWAETLPASGFVLAPLSAQTGY
ncbi:MAG: divergent polysaccharide deacetylase family protein [Rhodospirillales bacterium]|nr:divergent polysaccharide deacetylase family protein [Rhodospirillales bacterium]